MYGENSAGASKSLIGTAIIHCSYLELTKRGSTHYARFNSDIEVGISKDAQRKLFHDGANG
jgi:hypothetical protein